MSRHARPGALPRAGWAGSEAHAWWPYGSLEGGVGGGGSGFSGRRRRRGRGWRGHHEPAVMRILRGAGSGGGGGRRGEVLRHEPEGPFPGLQPKVMHRRLGSGEARRARCCSGRRAAVVPGVGPLPRPAPSAFSTPGPPCHHLEPPGYGPLPGPVGTRFLSVCPPSLLSQVPLSIPASCTPLPGSRSPRQGHCTCLRTP